MEGVESVYEQIGEAGFAALIGGFYERVRRDPVLAPMYPEDDWEGAERRLQDFVVGRFGGPPRYIERRGHPRLRMRHARFHIDSAARNRWTLHMDASMGACVREGLIPAEAARVITSFLHHLATHLVNAEG